MHFALKLTNTFIYSLKNIFLQTIFNSLRSNLFEAIVKALRVDERCIIYAIRLIDFLLVLLVEALCNHNVPSWLVFFAKQAELQL